MAIHRIKCLGVFEEYFRSGVALSEWVKVWYHQKNLRMALQNVDIILMPLFVRLIVCFALTSLVGSAYAATVPTGQPWHRRSDIEQALAEAAFQGMASTNPAIGVTYGAYKVIEFGRKVTDSSVDVLNVETERDLLIIGADAARLRALVDEGRFPSTDPEARAIATSLRQRAESLPGGTNRFIARALLDRRTLYVATRNYAGSKLFGALGGRVAGWLGVREVTPVLRVSMKGIKGRFKQAQWKVIRHIARRFDLLAEKMAKEITKVLITGIVSEIYDERVRRQIDSAVRDFKARNPPRPPPMTPDPLRLRVIEAAPLYVPVAAAVVAKREITLQRAEDPVIDYATVQNQIAHEYKVEVPNTTATEQTKDWDDYGDRSSHIPDVKLPSGSVNFDGSRLY